jgi:HSP20 family molecular chaperone IbpA
MNSQQVMPVPICIAETIIDEIEEMYDRITKRAYEIFRERGGNCTLDLEDWLTAERELLYKPEVHVEEVDRRIVVTVRIGRVRPLDVQLLVTPDAIVIQAQPAGTTRKVFRTVQFPRRIDVNKAEATYAEGYLVFTAA